MSLRSFVRLASDNCPAHAIRCSGRLIHQQTSAGRRRPEAVRMCRPEATRKYRPEATRKYRPEAVRMYRPEAVRMCRPETVRMCRPEAVRMCRPEPSGCVGQKPSGCTGQKPSGCVGQSRQDVPARSRQDMSTRAVGMYRLRSRQDVSARSRQDVSDTERTKIVHTSLLGMLKAGAYIIIIKKEKKQNATEASHATSAMTSVSLWSATAPSHLGSKSVRSCK